MHAQVCSRSIACQIRDKSRYDGASRAMPTDSELAHHVKNLWTLLVQGRFRTACAMARTLARVGAHSEVVRATLYQVQCGLSPWLPMCELQACLYAREHRALRAAPCEHARADQRCTQYTHCTHCTQCLQYLHYISKRGNLVGTSSPIPLLQPGLTLASFSKTKHGIVHVIQKKGTRPETSRSGDISARVELGPYDVCCLPKQ